MVNRNVQKKRLHFSTSLKESIEGAEVIFIAVGTPPDEDGSADLKYVLTVAAGIGEHMQQPLVVVTKSTVPVSTAEKVRKALQEQLDKLDLNYLLIGIGEVEIKEELSDVKLKQLTSGLKNYSIEIVESHKSILVQKIKDAIIQMVYSEEKLPNSKTSSTEPY